MNGYTGNILHVDLTKKKLTIENPGEDFYRKYIGGSAMGMAYIVKNMPAGVDAYDPANVLTMMISAPTGVPISGQSRMTANARSPLAAGIGDSQCGGFFPAELKFAGFDGLVIQGKAETPVYIWLHEGEAELRDASHLWGKTTSQVETMLKQEHGGDKIQVAQCGPAGERLVRTACIINMANRANGRTGMGAVMGSKNLKAVVVRGKSKRLPVADQKGITSLARWGVTNLQNYGGIVDLQINGTAGVVAGQHLSGGLPTRNFSEGQFEAYQAISGDTLTSTLLIETDTCYACAVRCKRVVEGEWQGHQIHPVSGGPEYETLATLGSYCGIGDLAAISYANQLCNEYGMDTISTGATIAWAMECYEAGLLTEEETGMPLHFGDANAVVTMLEAIASREGFGNVLAEGSARAADQLEKGHEFLITSKGNEAPAHMPQAKRSLALIYAVNPFGADHQSHEHDPSIEEGQTDEINMSRLKEIGFEHTIPQHDMGPEKVRYALVTQQFYSFLDSADLCQFVWGPAWHLYGPDQTVSMIRMVTGWDDFSIEELLKIGERRINLMRVFNQREGLDSRADTLPEKFFKPLKGSGPTAGVAIDPEEFEHAKQIYYELSGWDANGLPKKETLKVLGLDWVFERM